MFNETFSFRHPRNLIGCIVGQGCRDRHAHPLIQDEKAVEMVGQIDYNFSRFEKGGKLTQVGVAVRTPILDTALSKYFEYPPGCGGD